MLRVFRKLVVLIVIFLLPLSAAASSDFANKEDVARLWDEIAPLLSEKYPGAVAEGRTYGLYEIGDIMNNMLFYLERTQNKKIINDLSDFYLEIISKSSKSKTGEDWYYHFNSEKYDGERILHSAQFIYSALKLYRLMHQFGIEKFEYFEAVEDIIIKGHLWRWIFYDKAFHRQGWGCSLSHYTHKEHILNLYGKIYWSKDRKSYCNVFRDDDMWIAASAAEYLISQYYDPNSVGAELVEPDQVTEYVEIARKLLEQRYSTEWDSRFSGLRGQFEYGAYTDIEDYKYAMYEYSEKACDSCKIGKCNSCNIEDSLKSFHERGRASREAVGWDIAHARRVVPVFLTFMEFSGLYGKDFPTEQTLAEIARQLSYVVWNGDVTDPKFANYFDGSNGWYRVGYNDQKNFGYPPYSRSEFVSRAGYGVLRSYDARLDLAMNSMYCKYQNTNNGPFAGRAWNFMLAIESSEAFGALKDCHELKFLGRVDEFEKIAD